jgi:hypothetical protein
VKYYEYQPLYEIIMKDNKLGNILSHTLNCLDIHRFDHKEINIDDTMYLYENKTFLVSLYEYTSGEEDTLSDLRTYVKTDF